MITRGAIYAHNIKSVWSPILDQLNVESAINMEMPNTYIPKIIFPDIVYFASLRPCLASGVGSSIELILSNSCQMTKIDKS